MFYAASYSWPNLSAAVATDAGEAQAEAFAGRLADAAAKKPPEVPFEVWNTVPIDSDRCMDAVRSMSRGQ